jgi:hypothetical protein
LKNDRMIIYLMIVNGNSLSLQSPVDVAYTLIHVD